MVEQQKPTGAHPANPKAVGLAARLYVLDRWPTVVAEPRVWDRFSFEQAFDHRWNGTPVPGDAQRAYDQLTRTAQAVRNARPVARTRTWWHRRIADQSIAARTDLSTVNNGPGGRKGNSFQVAVAVDAHLNGRPSTAMGWSDKNDPILVIPLSAVTDVIGGVERVVSRATAEDLVRSWGPGAKAIVSLRDPASTFHRLFNVTNRDGQITFIDCSAKGCPDPIAAADATLATVDEGSPFASIQLWRTRNLPGASRLPDNFLALDDAAALAVLNHAMPSTSVRVRQLTLAKIRFAGDVQYGFWLIEQIRNGGCTFLPPDLARFTSDDPLSVPEPLSQLDNALVTLASIGFAKVWGDRFEVTAPDHPVTHRLIAQFDGAATRSGSIDGLAPGSVEVSIPADCLRRPSATATATSDDHQATALMARPEQTRQFSWVDVNRAVSPGQRKTNCWNCAAAVARWLTDHSPASGLPIYPASGFRPTIPEYVELLEPQSDTVFVTDRQHAERVVRSWGPGSHGLVVASLNDTSTHMFNVVLDGDRVRYLDGYVGKEGDFNFDVMWERIGVVHLGSVAPSHRRSVRSSDDSQSPIQPDRGPEGVRPLLSL